MIDTLYKSGITDISIVEDFTDITTGPEDVVDQAEDTMTLLSKHIDNLTLNVDNDKIKNLRDSLEMEYYKKQLESYPYDHSKIPTDDTIK